MAHSRKLEYTFNSLNLSDNSSPEIFIPVRPSYTGDLKYSVQSSDHNGWLKCDGRSLNRTIYDKLFAVIGTAFGSADSESFNIPDCRGRVLGIIGAGTGLTSRTLGASVGAETHTLTTSEMPVHNHGITDPGHTHGYINHDGNQGVNTLTTQDTAADEFNYNSSTGSSTTGITVNNAGGGNPHNNMQPTIFISNVFIFCSQHTP